MSGPISPRAEELGRMLRASIDADERRAADMRGCLRVALDRATWARVEMVRALESAHGAPVLRDLRDALANQDAVIRELRRGMAL